MVGVTQLLLGPACSLFKALLLSGCTIYAMPGIAIASYCLFFSWLILSLLLLKLREKHRGTSTPDSPPNVLPIYKFKSKENGGGVLLAAGTKKKSASLSGEDVVISIINKFLYSFNLFVAEREDFPYQMVF